MSILSAYIYPPQPDDCGGDLVNVPSLDCPGEKNSLVPTLRSNERMLTNRYLDEEEFGAWANSIIQILFLKPYLNM